MNAQAAISIFCGWRQRKLRYCRKGFALTVVIAQPGRRLATSENLDAASFFIRGIFFIQRA
jgi:hypothetical protein